MILGYHIIFGAYGFWLPNDPRGSWSDFVAAWELRRFGPATTTDERRSLAAEPHGRDARIQAKQSLKYPAVEFTGLQARAIARGFASFVQTSGLIVWACSILPQHVHLVIGRHHYQAEQIANLLKGAASRQLNEEGLHPLAQWPTRTGRMPKCWERRQWIVYLDTEEDIARAIPYVEQNPEKEGKRRRRGGS